MALIKMDIRSQTVSFRYLHQFIYCGKAARCVCHSLDIDVSISLFCTDVPQSALETVVPKTQDAHVRVVRGRLRGQVSGYYSVCPCFCLVMTADGEYIICRLMNDL